jgi:hypothetical protein
MKVKNPERPLIISDLSGERGRPDRIRRRPADGIFGPKPLHRLGDSAIRAILPGEQDQQDFESAESGDILSCKSCPKRSFGGDCPGQVIRGEVR